MHARERESVSVDKSEYWKEGRERQNQIFFPNMKPNITNWFTPNANSFFTRFHSSPQITSLIFPAKSFHHSGWASPATPFHSRRSTMPPAPATSDSPRSEADSPSNVTLAITATDKNQLPIVIYLGPPTVADLTSITVSLAKAYSPSVLSSLPSPDCTHWSSLLFFSSHSLLWFCRALLPPSSVSGMSIRWISGKV